MDGLFGLVKKYLLDRYCSYLTVLCFSFTAFIALFDSSNNLLQTTDTKGIRKNLGCKQIKFFINLEIIGEEDKDKKKKKNYYVLLK